MKEKDINIKIEDYTLNCRATAIILNNDKILFQKKVQDKYWALPGGKINVGETTAKTLARELKEELGLTNYKIENICLIAEHFFDIKNEYIYQKEEFKGIEQEKPIIFKLIDKLDLTNIPLKPDFLKKQLLNLENKEIQFTFYREQ